MKKIKSSVFEIACLELFTKSGTFYNCLTTETMGMTFSTLVQILKIVFLLLKFDLLFLTENRIIKNESLHDFFLFQGLCMILK